MKFYASSNTFISLRSFPPQSSYSSPVSFSDLSKLYDISLFSFIFVLVFKIETMNNFKLVVLASILYATSSCVPARKFDEIAEKQEICAKDLKMLK